ncbi:MAG: 1-(5-phosphoribosyl)-5-[(5-phosphoribosylamino)methylideneamino]imidazole-4-carboxamide isomerase [Ginsengibacter sp.]
MAKYKPPIGDRGFIIPAIDVIDGKCVRLTEGDYSTGKVYYSNPLEAAKRFEDAGFKRLHMVDLDGAKSGNIKNLATLETVAGKTKMVIDFSGGIKTSEDIVNVFGAGAALISIGSVAVKNPGLLQQWIAKFGVEKFLVGADVLDENIKISGWLKDGGITINDFIRSMLAIGIKTIFCTDISKDGKMAGPSIDLYKDLLTQFTDLNLIASGGVNTLDDIIELRRIGCKGVIVGKAIYEGTITLEDLIKHNY